MSSFGFTDIVKTVYSFLTVIFLLLIYTYIVNLENKGCACALTSNVNFIKGFTLFAIVYLLITGFVPDKFLVNSLGQNIVILGKIIDLIFVLIFIYYLYNVFQYTRYLVNEKCKCSADIRREIIMIGSLIEFALVFVLFLLLIMVVTVSSVLFIIAKIITDASDKVHGIIDDPIGSLKKVPQTLKSEINELGSIVSKTSKNVRKTLSTRKSTKSTKSSKSRK
jgi:hypothetical protein